MQVLVDGRVRRSAREWQKIIERYRKSSLSIAAFCEKEEISRGAFSTWRRRLSGDQKKRPAFVELTRPRAKSPAATSAPERETFFELTFPGGVSLRWRG